MYKRPPYQCMIRRAFFVVLSCALPAAAFAALRFEAFPANRGLSMTHASPYLTTGQACADVNRDGRIDLFLTSNGGNRLFLQQSDGSFSASAANSALALPAQKSGGTLFFDYDNDSWPDLLVLGDGPNHLFHNLSGSGWADVTAQSGLSAVSTSQSAAVADYDLDGLLDIYVVNWFPDGGEASPISADRLYRNLGNGVFEDVSSLMMPAATRQYPGFAATWGDFDNDGDLDLYVVNDKLFGNPMWRNDGPGCGGWCFTEISTLNGSNRPAWGMGIATADYDRDGDLDFYFSSIGEMVLLRNDLASTGNYVEVTDAAGVNVAATGWGAEFLDADNDGWQDLVLSTMSPVSATGNRLYRNLGNASFSDESAAAGIADTLPTIGLARCDIDLDGRTDLIFGEFNQQYRFLQNLSDVGNAVRVHLEGGMGVNRDAIGSRVWLTDSNGGVQMQEVKNGSSIGGGSETDLQFGLGIATPAQLEIRWPDGTRTAHAMTATAGTQSLSLSLSNIIVFRSGFD
jgi:enediyne biosynthesis protein E4